jgi:hypothetical protein
MRKAINENPVVQISVIGVLLVVVGFFLVTRVMGGGSEENTAVPPNAPIGTDASAGAGTTPAPTAGTPTPGSVATDAAAPVAPASSAPVAADAGSVSPEALIPGPGLPAPVKRAWDRGDAIVLLIVRGPGPDDRLVRGSVNALSEPGTSVFVARAKQIARYSRITQGVGVTRVPALVVVRPRGVSGPVPEAQVSYGFRDSQSVVQAVNDALYQGRDDLPYSPG